MIRWNVSSQKIREISREVAWIASPVDDQDVAVGCAIYDAYGQMVENTLSLA